MHRHQGADRHEAELSERHLARPTSEHRQRQSDDGVDADLAHQHVVADGEDEREQRCRHDDEPDARRRHPAAQLIGRHPHGGRRAMFP